MTAREGLSICEKTGHRQCPASGAARPTRELQRVGGGAAIEPLTACDQRRLSRLRHALGDVLLVRDGNRMSLSPRAERLLPGVRLVMTEIGLALRDYLFDPTTSERTFRIARCDYDGRG
jgi:hypothetical protein